MNGNLQGDFKIGETRYHVELKGGTIFITSDANPEAHLGQWVVAVQELALITLVNAQHPNSYQVVYR